MHGQNFATLGLVPSNVPQVEAAVASSTWQISEYDFDYLQLGETLVDPALDPLRERFEMFGLRVLRIPPMSCYTWHADITRHCAINMALQLSDSISFFRVGGRRLLLNVEICKYTLGRFVLFNTQRQHMIVNYGQTDRLMLTTSFKKPTTFKEVRQFCEERGLLSQGSGAH